MERVAASQTLCRKAVSSGIRTAADPPSSERFTSGLTHLQGSLPSRWVCGRDPLWRGNSLTNDADFQFADLDHTLHPSSWWVCGRSNGEWGPVMRDIHPCPFHERTAIKGWGFLPCLLTRGCGLLFSGKNDSIWHKKVSVKSCKIHTTRLTLPIGRVISRSWETRP